MRRVASAVDGKRAVGSSNDRLTTRVLTITRGNCLIGAMRAVTCRTTGSLRRQTRRQQARLRIALRATARPGHRRDRDIISGLRLCGRMRAAGPRGFVLTKTKKRTALLCALSLAPLTNLKNLKKIKRRFAGRHSYRIASTPAHRTLKTPLRRLEPLVTTHIRSGTPSRPGPPT